MATTGEWFTRDFVPPAWGTVFDDLLHHSGAVTQLPARVGRACVSFGTGSVSSPSSTIRLVHRALREAVPTPLSFGDRLQIYMTPRLFAPWCRTSMSWPQNYDVDSPDGWIARYYLTACGSSRATSPSSSQSGFLLPTKSHRGNRNNGTVTCKRKRACPWCGGGGAAVCAAAANRREPLVPILRTTLGEDAWTGRIITSAGGIDDRPL